jgi:hypothetical protein
MQSTSNRIPFKAKLLSAPSTFNSLLLSLFKSISFHFSSIFHKYIVLFTLSIISFNRQIYLHKTMINKVKQDFIPHPLVFHLKPEIINSNILSHTLGILFLFSLIFNYYIPHFHQISVFFEEIGVSLLFDFGKFIGNVDIQHVRFVVKHFRTKTFLNFNLCFQSIFRRFSIIKRVRHSIIKFITFNISFL